MPQTTFAVTVSMELKGLFPDFPQAFKRFWEDIMETLYQGTSWQVLETMNFLVMITDDGRQLPLDFYAARDLAYEIGLLQQTESGSEPSLLEAPTMENWQDYVVQYYRRAIQDHVLAMQRGLLEKLLKLLRSVRELDQAHGCGSEADPEPS